MFAAVHSTSSAGSKGYHTSHLPHTRFSVHMFQGKPGFGGTTGYLSSNSGIDPSGYRGIPPPLAPSVYHQSSYQERYSPPLSIPTGQALVHHGSTPQVPIPGRHPSPPHLNLNTGASRVYEPPRLPQPSPPVLHQRGAHLHAASHPAPPAKFSIYPSNNGQSTFIYEQSLTSKSDLFSEADTDATSIMTYSPTESTATVGGDTPLGSPLDAPSAPAPMERSTSRSGANIPSQHQARSGQWTSAPSAIPHAAALMKTPSETSIDVRERIAVMNAKHNSASTGSYYSSSPPMSTDGTIPLHHQASQHSASAMATAVSSGPSQVMFPEVFVQGSPELYDRRTPAHQVPPATSTYATNGSIYTSEASYRPDPSGPIAIRERKSSMSYMMGNSPPTSYPAMSDRERDSRRHAPNTVPFASTSPPSNSRDRYEGRESSRRDRERDWDKENRGKYASSSSPPEIRSRTSSMSHGNGRPSDALLVPPTMQVAGPLYVQEESSSDRRPRHPDLAASQVPPTRSRRTSFASQVSEATLTTAATAGTEMGRQAPPNVASQVPPTPITQSPPRVSAPRHPELPRRHSDAEKMAYDRERSEKDRQRERSPNHTSSSYPPRHPETQRRYSDGDQKLPLRITTSPSKGGSRSVRWNENLICPSPITPAEKRVGWFNRRGDQLWTNDGVFKAALPGQQYPPDLDDYPEAGEGWMNEDGVTIDIEHRRVPKLPRRPALKQAKTN